MSTTNVVSADEEVASLDRLLTRLALTEDDKLEKVLSKLLPLAIARLASPHEASRKKVMEMLTHVNKRIRDHSHIKLPLVELLALYRSPASAAVPMVFNFAMVYTEMAFERSNTDIRETVLSDLLEGLSTRPLQHQGMFLRCAAAALESYGVEKGAGNIEKLAERFPFLKHGQDSRLWLEFSLHTMLYRSQTAQADGQSPPPPPGLSLQQAQQVAGNAKQSSQLRGEKLASRKVALLNFNCSLGFLGADLYLQLLVAAVDSDDRVSRRGEELLKRKGGSVNLEDLTLVHQLFGLYQGNAAGLSSVPAESRKTPASVTLKLRLLSALNHSAAAANCFPATLKVVFDSVYGEGTTMRLKQAGMEFAVWVFKHATEEQLKPMAPVILAGLLKSLQESDADDPDKAVQQLRAFTFQAIGQLAQRAPHLFSGSAQMAVNLFQALRKESSHTRSVLQEAVTSLSGAYKECGDNVRREIEALLLENVAAAEDPARFCAVQWACQLFPAHNAPARFICMIGCGDSKLEIREMAERGLFPVDSETNVEAISTELPIMGDLLTFIVQQRPQIMALSPIGEQTLMFPSSTYAAMLKFLQKCQQAIPQSHTTNVETSGGDIQRGPDERYRMLLEHGLARDGTWALHVLAAQGLLELGAAYPEKIANEYAGRLPWLKQFVSHQDGSTREAMARLLGITAQALQPDSAAKLLQELLEPALKHSSGKYRFEESAGGLSAAGYVLAQARTGCPMVEEKVQEASAITLSVVLDEASDNLAKTAGEALGHVGLRGPIPLPENQMEISAERVETDKGLEGGKEGEAAVSDDTSSPSRARVVKRLAALFSSNDVKVVQSSVLALGHICYGERTLADSVLEAFFGLARSKAEEVLFAVGESLSLIWGGLLNINADTFLRTPFISLTTSYNFLASDSNERPDTIMVDAEAGASGPSAELTAGQAMIKRKLLDELLVSGRKEDRCAGAVWMLSLVTYSGRSASIQALLPEIQEAFSHLLGDSNELTQEMASRGMSLVYDLADASLREQLVESLVGALSGTTRKKRAVKLMEESEVFSDDALGKAPGGGNINTYKELCTLATDMGQPDLIYKFMDLANYQASLNSRRGAAFGFAKIAKQAGEALQPHLEALVPKLLRHQYDPSKAIQDAMAHIWRALVPEPKKTIDQLWVKIMEDLLKESGSRLWRTRESACLALTDLLLSRRFDEVAPYFSQLWVMAFRVADDIKESVRLSGEKLCRTLSSLSIRLCDPSLTPQKDASEACEIVLPILLNQGILSGVPAIQRLSLNTISKLVKGAGSAVRKVLPDVVVAMLEALSSLEDQKLNYAELHAERVGINTQKLENVRLSLAKDSPMWDTLDWCVRQVDMATLESLTPRLAELTRTGVGLNTRAGVARFISQLVERCGPVQMKPQTAALLKVLIPALRSEKSPSARRAFATACADVARCSGEARVHRLVEEAVDLNRGDKEARICGALLIRELTRVASDLLSNDSTAVLPLTFIGRYDSDVSVKSLFEEVWDESSSSTSAAVQLYLPEITALICDGIQSSSWPRKKQCAEATVALAELVREDMGKDNVQRLLKAFLQELPGRLWEGKESCLEAIGALCKGCGTIISSTTVTGEEIGAIAVTNAVVAACQRPKTAFREASLLCLKQALTAFKNQDLLALVAAPLVQICSQPSNQTSTSTDGGESSTSREKTSGNGSTVLVSGIQCLSAAMETLSAESLSVHGESIVKIFVTNLGSSSTWTVRLASLEASKKLAMALERPGSLETGEVYKTWLEIIAVAILDTVGDSKHAQVRTGALETLQTILTVSHGQLLFKGNKLLTSRTREVLLDLVKTDKNANIRTLASTVAESLPRDT